MIDRELDIETSDGSMNTFITHPEEGGPFPVVLFFMDAYGRREELHDMARRIGTAGYYVALPNLYYRSVRAYDGSQDPDGMLERTLQLVDTLDYDTLTTDTEGLLRCIDDDPVADSTNVGAVGYCMSGRFSYAIAGLFPDRISAAASIYGVYLHGEASPQELTTKVQGELYFACAEHDTYVPASMIEELEHHLADAGVASRVEWYPGAHHGFAFPDRDGAYDKVSCERHYERLFDLFDRRLRSRTSRTG